MLHSESSELWLLQEGRRSFFDSYTNTLSGPVSNVKMTGAASYVVPKPSSAKLTLPVAAEADDTVAGDTTTTATLSVGDSINGTIDFSGDQDWYAVQLEAGQRYVFTMSGSGVAGSLQDPYLEIMDANGNQLGFNDDAGGTLNSTLNFTATTSGTYYINAHAWADSSGVTGEGDFILTMDTAPPLENWTNDEIAEFLTSGYWSPRRWGNTTITYNVEGLTPEAQLLAVAAFNEWSAVSNLNLIRTTSSSANIIVDDEELGDAHASTTTSGQDTDGYAIITSAEINIGSDWFGGDTSLDSYTYQTYLHEIGHALGLGHAGNYNSQATFGNDNLYLNDSWATTVMSYFDQVEASSGSYRFALGPQEADLIAIQTLYGANASGTRSGDTVYGFNSTETDVNDWSQFVVVDSTGTYLRPPSMAIYDTGGTDTIDLSGYSRNQSLDLTPGARSTLGDRADSANPNYVNVISIAETTIIENAIGGAGNDSLTGNLYANYLSGNAGRDYLDGGDGASLTAIEDQVFRVYLATLGRSPDPAGLANWTSQIESGARTLVEVISGFVQSSEFQEKYGNLDDTEFVTLLYNNVLGRDPDNSGLQSWLNQLADGRSRESVVTGFSESAEFKGLTALQTDGYATNVKYAGIEGQIYRMYIATLDRAPDTVGFQNFVTQMQDNGLTYEEVIPNFINSTEFRTKYGSLNNVEFVTLLYNNVLNRDPDDQGLSNWVSQLDDGATRASVVRGFAESAELKGTTQAALDAFIENAMRVWSDTLEGNAGNDIMLGGRGADTFIFNASEDGADVVSGLDQWDTIVMEGFGYASSSDFAAHLTRSGLDVIFSDQGVTITFRSTSITQVTSLVEFNTSGEAQAKTSILDAEDVFDFTLLDPVDVIAELPQFIEASDRSPSSLIQEDLMTLSEHEIIMSDDLDHFNFQSDELMDVWDIA